MNFNKQPPAALGAFLIGLGLVWWLNLWSLLLPAALLVGGVVAYQQRRRMGRLNEAVQVGLWGVGLAVLFMLHFIWPGILFLAGASVLLRGRESRADAFVQQAIARAPRRVRPVAHPTPTQYVPISSQPAPAQPAQSQVVEAGRAVTTGETTRL
jgi:hypothetical protein